MTRNEKLTRGEDVKQAGREGGKDDMQFHVESLKPVSHACGSHTTCYLHAGVDHAARDRHAVCDGLAEG